MRSTSKPETLKDKKEEYRIYNIDESRLRVKSETEEPQPDGTIRFDLAGAHHACIVVCKSPVLDSGENHELPKHVTDVARCVIGG